MNRKILRSLSEKIREALISVLPVSLIVLLLSFTPALSLSGRELAVFCVCTVCMILGIGLFNLGADMAMSPMGEHIGAELTKTRKTYLLLPISFVLGLLITVAEPDLSVLASQVAETINGTVLIAAVGIGVGLCLLIGVIKILTHADLSKMLFFFYLFIFALAAVLAECGKSPFLPLSFDSGGVTTGPVTVPFIMAMGIGIAAAVGGDRAEENSFGLIALCSVGPLIALMTLSLTSRGAVVYELPDYEMPARLLSGSLAVTAETALDVIKALALIAVFFLILQVTVLRLPRTRLLRIVIGIAYTFVGLVIFLTAVSIGFMPVGFKIGQSLSELSPWIVVSFGTLIGMVTVLAEPAVHVLTQQVESVTGGGVSKRSMLLALCIGVGVSIGLSCLRIVFGFSVLYYLVPGYLISLGLSLFVPGIYTAIAFDSGGVASGPLTSSFILPMMIGICASLQGPENVLNYAFGAVAMVAMTPLITIQALGFRAIAARKLRRRIAMKRILDADDEQIIYFSVQGGNHGN